MRDRCTCNPCETTRREAQRHEEELLARGRHDGDAVVTDVCNRRRLHRRPRKNDMGATDDVSPRTRHGCNTDDGLRRRPRKNLMSETDDVSPGTRHGCNTDAGLRRRPRKNFMCATDDVSPRTRHVCNPTTTASTTEEKRSRHRRRSVSPTSCTHRLVPSPTMS